MSAGQSSSKKNVAFQKQEVVTSAQTGSYTATTSWVNVGNGYSITIPTDGYYLVRAQGTVHIDWASNNQCGCYLRLYDGVAQIPNAVIHMDKYSLDGSDIEVRYPFHLESQYRYFAAGTIITLQAQKTNTDPVYVDYSAGISEGFIEAVLQNGVVPTIPNDSVYSTTEINTGKVWIDGKSIYRKVVDFGLLPNTTAKNVAHGISTLDKVVSFYGTSDDGTYQIPIPHVNTAGLNISYSAYVDQTIVNITTGGATHITFYAYVTIEYTKV